MRTPNWKLLFGLMVIILQAAAVVAYPSADPTKLCHSNQRTVTGAIEMYNMDHDASIAKQYGNTNVIKMDGKFLKILLEKNYLRNVSNIEESIKENNCAYYYLPTENEDSLIIICKKHGSVILQGDDSKKLSPKEQFAKLCKKFGLDPLKYKLDLEDETFSGVKGPLVIKLLTNLWPAFLIFSVVFFFSIKKNFSEINTMAKAYLLGNSIVAMVFVLSFLHNYYRSPYFFAFVYDESTWRYPSGVLQIATMVEISCIGWWVASFFGLYLFKKNNISLLIPVLNLLIIPVLIVGSGPMTSLLTILPLFGLFMFYTMAKLKAD